MYFVASIEYKHYFPYCYWLLLLGSTATDDDDDVFWYLYSPSFPSPAKPYVLISNQQNGVSLKNVYMRHFWMVFIFTYSLFGLTRIV